MNLNQNNIVRKLRKPDLTLWGPLKTEAYPEPEPELIDEVLSFYKKMLVPELVCAPGRVPDYPSINWIQSKKPALIIVRGVNSKYRDQILGCWFLRGGAILYPVLDVTKGADGCMPIMRALSYKSFELVGEEMNASTENPLIQAWVNHATDTPEEGRPEKMPLPKFQDGRIEWKRDV